MRTVRRRMAFDPVLAPIMAQETLETMWPPQRQKADGLIRLIPPAFVLIWSSAFISSKVGLRHLSPLLFVAIRLIACAVVLTLSMLVLRRSWRALGQGRWLHCAV